MSQPTCETCVYWMDNGYADGTGECRRYPPVINPAIRLPSQIEMTDEAQSRKGLFDLLTVIHDHPAAVWLRPTVCNSDWCGEHKPA